MNASLARRQHRGSTSFSKTNSRVLHNCCASGKRGISTQWNKLRVLVSAWQQKRAVARGLGGRPPSLLLRRAPALTAQVRYAQ